MILRAVRDNASESLDEIAAALAHEIIPRLASAASVLMARAGRLIALGESASLMDADLRQFESKRDAGSAPRSARSPTGSTMPTSSVSTSNTLPTCST